MRRIRARAKKFDPPNNRLRPFPARSCTFFNVSSIVERVDPPLSEFCHVPSVMRCSTLLLQGRAAWKGPSFVVLPNIVGARKANTPLRTKALDMEIVPNIVGVNLLVHNGKDWQALLITDEMVGYKLRNFIRTIKPFRFKKDEPMPAY